MRFSKEIRHLFKTAKIRHFPIGLNEIQQIIKHYGWEIYSYREATDIIERYGLKEMAESNDSFAVSIGDRTVIFYDDGISQLDFPRILAHEIGHIILGHLNDVGDIYAKERDSDRFADELLSYVPRKISPIIGIATAVLMFIGIFSYFSADKPNGIGVIEVSATSIAGNPDAVYVTKFNNKYHLISCWHISDKDDLIQMSVDEAEQNGHEPCDTYIGE